MTNSRLAVCCQSSIVSWLSLMDICEDRLKSRLSLLLTLEPQVSPGAQGPWQEARRSALEALQLIHRLVFTPNPFSFLTSSAQTCHLAWQICRPALSLFNHHHIEIGTCDFTHAQVREEVFSDFILSFLLAQEAFGGGGPLQGSFLKTQGSYVYSLRIPNTSSLCAGRARNLPACESHPRLKKLALEWFHRRGFTTINDKESISANAPFLSFKKTFPSPGASTAPSRHQTEDKGSKRKRRG